MLLQILNFLLGLSIISLVFVTYFGMVDDQYRYLTGHKLYKVDLFPLAILNGLVIILLFFIILKLQN